MLEVTNLSDPKHVVFLALRWCHTLEHSSGVFVHCTKRIYCTWQLTIWNGKYSLNLLLEHAEFKFQTLAITLFIQTEMHIHMHAHMRIMSKSMLVVQRTFFAQMWFSLQNLSIIYFPKLEIFKSSLERKYFVVSKAFVQWLRLYAVLLRVEAHNQTWTMLAKVEK